MKLLIWARYTALTNDPILSETIVDLADVVKTRIQQYPERYTEGALKAARDIVSTEGIGFLLAGLGKKVRPAVCVSVKQRVCGFLTTYGIQDA